MAERKKLENIYESLWELTTERRNPDTSRIDLASTEAILEMMNREDRTVPGAVARAIPTIAAAADLGLPVNGDMSGHPALAPYVEQGYRVITF